MHLAPMKNLHFYLDVGTIQVGSMGSTFITITNQHRLRGNAEVLPARH